MFVKGWKKLPLRAVRRSPFPVGEDWGKASPSGELARVSETEEGRHGREYPVIV